jgi:proline iminopeptidase
MQANMQNNQLYPITKPHLEFLLDVGDGHQIHVEETGAPNGIPVLFLHGGPGAGLTDNYSRMFDCTRYRIIAFEQRGCGRSIPFGELNDNTTAHLLADIERIRAYFGIEQWLLFGGSWGATLALLAAIKAPETVLGLILRGVFLGRKEDVDWFIAPHGGAAQLYPEHYEAFTQDITIHKSSTAKDVCDAFTGLFQQKNSFLKTDALRAWYGWEERISRIQHPYGDPLTNYNLNQVASLAMLECFYLQHDCFIPENYILDNIDAITHLPAYIIHGRYDMICKLESSYLLQQQWPNSQLHVVPDAGHSTSEPSIAWALKLTTDLMAKLL